MPASANATLPQPDRFFPDWQSIEIFGVPGAGKSFYCRMLVRNTGVFSTCDDQIARHYSDESFNPVERLLRSVTSRRLFKNFYRSRMNRTVGEVLKTPAAPIASYLANVEVLIENANLSPGTQKNVRDSVRRASAYLALAHQDQLQLVVDEGLLRKASTIIARSGGAMASRDLQNAVRRCLQSYPWQRNAMLLETSQLKALQRQRDRGHVISTEERPIDDFFGAIGLLSDLLPQSGWRLARISND